MIEFPESPLVVILANLCCTMVATVATSHPAHCPGPEAAVKAPYAQAPKNRKPTVIIRP